MLSRVIRVIDALRLSLFVYEPHEMVEIRVRGWSHGVFIRPATSDLPVLRKILIDREYEPPGGLEPVAILDAGAYIGLSSLFFHYCFPQARIIAVEPDRETFELLEANTRLIPEITRVNAGLWSDSKPHEFLADPAAPWASRVSEEIASSSRSIPCLTLRDAFELAGGKVELMKVDIEGGEAELFKGVRLDDFPSLKAIVIEFHERFFPGSSEPLLSAMQSRSHRVCPKGENTWFIFE